MKLEQAIVQYLASHCLSCHQDQEDNESKVGPRCKRIQYDGTPSINGLPPWLRGELKHYTPVGGVYFFVNGSGTIEYVGSSMNFGYRFKHHHIDMRKYSVQVLELSGWVEEDLRSFEAVLIALLKPRLNGVSSKNRGSVTSWGQLENALAVGDKVTLAYNQSTTWKEFKSELRVKFLNAVLKLNNGSQTRTAKQLGIQRSYLSKLINTDEYNKTLTSLQKRGGEGILPIVPKNKSRKLVHHKKLTHKIIGQEVVDAVLSMMENGVYIKEIMEKLNLRRKDLNQVPDFIEKRDNYMLNDFQNGMSVYRLRKKYAMTDTTVKCCLSKARRFRVNH
jgi:Mor family transcriptional regulator